MCIVKYTSVQILHYNLSFDFWPKKFLGLYLKNSLQIPVLILTYNYSEVPCSLKMFIHMFIHKF